MKMEMLTEKEIFLMDCLRHIAETSKESDIADFADQAIYISGSYPSQKNIEDEYYSLVDKLWECYCSEEPIPKSLYDKFWELELK